MRKTDHQCGSAYVECLIVLPMLWILLAGLIDTSVSLSQYMRFSDAVLNSARKISRIDEPNLSDCITTAEEILREEMQLQLVDYAGFELRPLPSAIPDSSFVEVIVSNQECQHCFVEFAAFSSRKAVVSLEHPDSCL